MVSIIKVVIIFKIMIFHLKILKKYKCVDASLRLQRILVKVAVQGFLGVAECESGIRFSKFKMTDSIWRSKFWKLFRIRWNCPYSGFWVAESKSAIKFLKLKMTDPIWWTKIWKTREKCTLLCFWGRWIRICCQIFNFQNCESNMASRMVKKVRNLIKLVLSCFWGH